ncbi:hypothetical protein M947_03260 [Sulfurimonas hongkongensis]|uniref:Uncharacterized protein n=1 Tax=Sulfurimonas hongkongensis TaxID=1172190 RepID=T0L2J9_9BACT|nr:hypothetical protein [Sulfurimonas hongkongensis]EQB40053.1 hypothetical protein M947_03260 [Sulfurimonas hongkongensis]
MFKSLMLFLFLLLWFLLAESSSCLVFLFYLFVLTPLLMLSLIEMPLIKKLAVASAIFHESSSLFSIFKSVWLNLFISLILAFVVATLMLVSSLYFDAFIFFILGFDILVLWGIYAKTKKYLATRVKEEFLFAVSRRWSIYINTLFLVLVFVVYAYFSTPSIEIKTFNCEILNFISINLRYKELLEYKLISTSLEALDYSKNIYIWLFYLLVSQGVFAWGYSRLLFCFESVDAILKTKQRYKNYFLFGFISTIILLFIISSSINYLYEKHHIKKSQAKIDKFYKDVDRVIDSKLNTSLELLLQKVDADIDKHVDGVFVKVYDGVPGLSAYYYSIKGEYSRIFLKAYSLYCGYKNDYLAPYYNQYLPKKFQLKDCNTEALEDEIMTKINYYLFDQNDFSTRVDEASRDIDKSIKKTMQEFQSQLRQTVSLLEIEHDIKPNSLELNFRDIFEANSRDMAKKGLSATGTLLISGAISKSIMSKMLLKFGAKGAIKASSFFGASMGGIALCAPSGPWALLCGVVTGTASWVGVDAAMTEVDQAFNEEDFKKSVVMMIDAQKNSLKNLMKDSYKEWIRKVFKELRDDANKLKSPYEQSFSKG